MKTWKNIFSNALIIKGEETVAEVSETTCLQIQYQKQQISVQNGAK